MHSPLSIHIIINRRLCPSLDLGTSKLPLLVLSCVFTLLFAPFPPPNSIPILPIMVYHAAVMYPNEEGIKFDEGYYVKTHMPLVESVWKKYGLQSWQIIRYSKDLSGAPSKYTIAAKLVWDSEEALQKALADPESKKIFADITNFTNVAPITLAGDGI